MHLFLQQQDLRVTQDAEKVDDGAKKCSSEFTLIFRTLAHGCIISRIAKIPFYYIWYLNCI